MNYIGIGLKQVKCSSYNVFLGILKTNSVHKKIPLAGLWIITYDDRHSITNCDFQLQWASIYKTVKPSIKSTVTSSKPKNPMCLFIILWELAKPIVYWQ